VRRPKSRRVEPLENTLLKTNPRISDNLRPLRAAADIRKVPACLYAEGRSRIDAVNAADRPATQQCVGNPAGRRQKGSSSPDRKLVNTAEDEHVLEVEIGGSPFPAQVVDGYNAAGLPARLYVERL